MPAAERLLRKDVLSPLERIAEPTALGACESRWGCQPVLLAGVICYHAATRTPGTRRIQEDIQLGRVAYFAYAWIVSGTLSTWIGTLRNQ
jgi:hypothetical protein